MYGRKGKKGEKMKNKPYCDHGHYAASVRRLPTSGGGAVILCRKHFDEEIDYSKYRNVEHKDNYDLPLWAELKT